MGYMTLPAAVAQEHGGIIETKTAIEHGISKAMLYKLCREDKIHRAVQGQYILPDDMQDKLLSISMRSHQIILSHEFFTVFQIGRSLSIRSQRRPITRCRPQSKKRMQGLLHQTVAVRSRPGCDGLGDHIEKSALTPDAIRSALERVCAILFEKLPGYRSHPPFPNRKTGGVTDGMLHSV